ncbi:PE-PPE domain-containing protein [Mycobacterium riyadhense]
MPCSSPFLQPRARHGGHLPATGDDVGCGGVVQCHQLVEWYGHHLHIPPAPILPMLLPLQQIGVPQPIVNHLNSVLQPIVNAGYSSLTPNAGPYLSAGSLIGFG